MRPFYTQAAPQPAAPGRKLGLLTYVARCVLGVLCFSVIVVELALYISLRTVITWCELLPTRRIARLFRARDAPTSSAGALFKALFSARTYDEYSAAATALDKLEGADEWKARRESRYYDFATIELLTHELRAHRRTALQQDGMDADRSFRRLLHTLKAACQANVGGIDHRMLYSQSRIGTKHLVAGFVDEVVLTINELSKCSNDRWPADEKGQRRATSQPADEKGSYFASLLEAWGHTALCLSGGATLGNFHLGVVRALHERNLLPEIISGSSWGAVVAVLIGTRTIEELKEVLRADAAYVCEFLRPFDEPIWTCARRWFRTGHVFDAAVWQQKMRKLCLGDTTFAEAYERTGRIISITVSSHRPDTPPLLLNHITTPHVLLSTAVLASGSVPHLLAPIQLLAKDEDGAIVPFQRVGMMWRDGSLQRDLPMKRLSQLFKVSYCITSQVNPHVVPFFFHARGAVGRPNGLLWSSGWRGGFFGSVLEGFLRMDMVKWIKILGDHDLLPPILGSWKSLFLQKFEGQVTIVPPATMRDYARLMGDLDQRTMQTYISRGEQRTYCCMSMIEVRLRIQNALIQSVKTFETQSGAVREAAHDAMAQRLRALYLN